MKTLEILALGAILSGLYYSGRLKVTPWIAGGKQSKTGSTKDRILTWIVGILFLGFWICFFLVRSGLWAYILAR